MNEQQVWNDVWKSLGPVWPVLLIGVFIAGAAAALFSTGTRKRRR